MIKLGKTNKKHLGQIVDSTLARFLTQKRPNLGQDFDSTAYIYMVSRQLGDHVFAFSQVNVWDAFAHRSTATFEVTPFPPHVSSPFLKIRNKRGPGVAHSQANE